MQSEGNCVINVYTKIWNICSVVKEKECRFGYDFRVLSSSLVLIEQCARWISTVLTPPLNTKRCSDLYNVGSFLNGSDKPRKLTVLEISNKQNEDRNTSWEWKLMVKLTLARSKNRSSSYFQGRKLLTA